ncbi:MAG TPA: hypothetical protein VL866_22735 [Pyrinomonadaceae bacterium]|nr:hypothetical protein [Pyrinomonadaceae bacterium]
MTSTHTKFQVRNRVVMRSLLVLLIAVALLSVNLHTRNVAAQSSPSTIVLQTDGAPLLQGTFQVVNNEQGNQFNPHVSCDLATYTSFDDLQGFSTVHYHSLVTGTDYVIPGNDVDLLSDVFGSLIAYTEITFSGDTIRLFDTNSQTSTVVPGFGFSFPSIGGNLVAFNDISSQSGGSDISTYDLTSGIVTKLTDDSFHNTNAEVSPNGNAVIWQKCTTFNSGCDIYSAIKTAPGVFTSRALTTGNHENIFGSATNGEVAVYVSDRSGERDIYYQPITGGTEVHLSIPGDQLRPNISGDLISFGSQDQNGYDIFVYDLRNGRLFQVTNTPSVTGLDNEIISDISVCGDTGRIVYLIVRNGGYDVYAFTFQVPSVPANQIDDLMALIGSFNLPPGISNSLKTKLQNALDAIEASDTATACSCLTAFINECRAQSGKKLTTDQATQLINSANQIKSDLGCP